LRQIKPIKTQTPTNQDSAFVNSRTEDPGNKKGVLDVKRKSWARA